jgi:hypothetical protein
VSDPHAFTASPPAGHNKGPRDAQIEADKALKVAEALISNFPKVTHKADADKVAEGIRNAQGALQAYDADRDTRVRPLNSRVKAINDEYRATKEAFATLIESLKGINRVWLKAEDLRRAAEAKRLREEAERKADEARRAQEEAAREAERAKDGDVTDGPLRPVEAARDAQEATLAARKAEATATKVEKERVTSGGGGTRAVGLATHIELKIPSKKDLIKIVTQIGMLDEFFIDDVIAACRRYHHKQRVWPAGLDVKEEKR